MSSRPNDTALSAHLAAVVSELPKELRALVGRLPPHVIGIVVELPVFVDRRVGAQLLTKHIVPVSDRSLEAWPLPWRRANGKAVSPTIAMFAVGFAKIADAPVIMGGRARKPPAVPSRTAA